jgi:hypothetical protein
MVLAVAGLLAKPAISVATNLINPSKAYEAKMDPVWSNGALTAVANHRRVGTPPSVWNGVVAAAPKGFAAYLPGDIWNPLPVTAPAGNTIPGNTMQGPRPGTEHDWVNGDHSSYPYPSASASAAPEVVGSPAAPSATAAGFGGSNSTILIVAILALVLFTRMKK